MIVGWGGGGWCHRDLHDRLEDLLGLSGFKFRWGVVVVVGAAIGC